METSEKEIEKFNITENKILRIQLDESWSTSDFSNLFESITILNNIFIEIETIELLGYRMLNIMEDESHNYINLNGELYKKLHFSDTYENSNIFSNKELLNINLFKPLMFKSNELKIKEIKYASPGWSDLVGLGKIMENIFELIKFYIPNKNQKLQNDITELDILEKKLAIMDKYGFKDKDNKRIIDLRNNSIRNLKLLKSLDKIKDFEIKEYK